MDVTPIHREADEGPRARRADPWWTYAVLTAFFVSFGLGRDLNSAWAGVIQFVCWVILAGAAWAQWRRRKTTTPNGSMRQRNDAVVWIVTVGFAAAAITVLFGGPVMFAGLGVPLPHTICGLAVGLMLIAAIPLGRWSVRRSAARAAADG